MRFVPVSSVKGKVAVFDVETTGLNPKISEVLQLAIVDQDGVVLNEFYDVHTDSWPEAEAVNGISKKMVDGYPYLSEEADKVSQILARYDVLAGYNISFDIEFLKRAGVRFPRAAIVDLMQDFSIFKDTYVLKKWKLSEAASWAGHDMMKKHDAVYDSQATLALFDKMQEVLQ